uniref:Uncharacterized protein n=1 Tax=Anguilla anguilla TaxID=7936 RepID=A0A0E9RUI8_ANGAN
MKASRPKSRSYEYLIHSYNQKSRERSIQVVKKTV